MSAQRPAEIGPAQQEREYPVSEGVIYTHPDGGGGFTRIEEVDDTHPDGGGGIFGDWAAAAGEGMFDESLEDGIRRALADREAAAGEAAAPPSLEWFDESPTFGRHSILKVNRGSQRDSKGSKANQRASAAVSVDFADEVTQTRMKAFWSSLSVSERNRFLSLSLKTVSSGMAGPSASRDQQSQRERFEKATHDMMELSKEIARSLCRATVNQHGLVQHPESALLLEADLEAEESALLLDERQMHWQLNAPEQQKLDLRKHFEVFKQYNMSHRHIFTLQQFVEEQEAARACLDWACSILCDQHQILDSSEGKGCDILADEESMITLPGYGEPESDASWQQFISLAVNGLPWSTGADRTRTRRQLESQLRTSDNMLDELEDKLSVLQRRARTFDNMVDGLRAFNDCGLSEVPEAMAPMHVYQAAFSCALQSVQTRVNYENRKRMVVDQRKGLLDQRDKIQEKIHDQAKVSNGEGEDGRFTTLLAERAHTMTAELVVLTEQISDLESYSSKAFDLQRNCRRLMDDITRRVTEETDSRLQGLHPLGMGVTPAERDRWCTGKRLELEEVQLFMLEGCSLQDCFQHAEYTAELLHSAMDKCYEILDDTTRTMNTMKKRVLMTEDALMAGSEVAAQNLKAHFQAAYQMPDQARAEQAEQENLDRQAQRAKELAEILIQEDEQRNNAKEHSKAPSKKKKGKGANGKKQKQKQQDQLKQQAAQAAQAQKLAVEQRQLQALEEAKLEQEAEYERQLQQEQLRVQLLCEQQIAEAKLVVQEQSLADKSCVAATGQITDLHPTVIRIDGDASVVPSNESMLQPARHSRKPPPAYESRADVAAAARVAILEVSHQLDASYRPASTADWRNKVSAIFEAKHPALAKAVKTHFDSFKSFIKANQITQHSQRTSLQAPSKVAQGMVLENEEPSKAPVKQGEMVPVMQEFENEQAALSLASPDKAATAKRTPTKADALEHIKRIRDQKNAAAALAQPSAPRVKQQPEQSAREADLLKQIQELKAGLHQQQPQQLRDAEAEINQLRAVEAQKVQQLQSVEAALATSQAEVVKLQQELEAATVAQTAQLQQTQSIQDALAASRTENADLKQQLAQLVQARPPKLDGPSEVSFEELVEATNSFSAVNLLGTGGQSSGVFRGEWRGKLVAVKRIKPHAQLGSRSFSRELAALSAVRHENVLRVLAYNKEGDPDGMQHLVMPLMDGGDLVSALPRLNAMQRMRAIRGSLLGLQALHEAAILHFDIKPANILLDAQDSPRLCDCGLARPMQQAGSNATLAEHSFASGQQVGTAGYIDPEFSRRHEYHRYCDVYSMGITILQILTGKPSVHWSDGTGVIEISDWCYDTPNESIADPAADWPIDVAAALLKLGFACTEIGRGAATRRPSVSACIVAVDRMAELPPLPVVADSLVKECVICLDGARGYIRFMPCRHSVCCQDCSDMLMSKDRASQLCPVCNQQIETFQKGHFPNTYAG